MNNIKKFGFYKFNLKIRKEEKFLKFTMVLKKIWGSWMITYVLIAYPNLYRVMNIYAETNSDIHWP